MFKPIKHIIIFLICITFLLNGNGLLFAQEEVPPEVIEMASGQPPMKNVFYNVLWGSVAGGMAVTGWAMLDDKKDKDDRYSLSNITTKFIIGATYGGLLGLFSGIYFSISNIEFDESRSRIAMIPPTEEDFDSNRYTTNLSSSAPSYHSFKSDEIPIASFSIAF